MLNNDGASATKSTKRLFAAAIAFICNAWLSVLPSHAVVLHGHVFSGNSELVANIAKRLPEPGLEGSWTSETEVTASSCQGVGVGTRVTSHVRFVRAADGTLQAGWEQPGWAVDYQSIRTISSVEASMLKRTSGLGENAGCAEESHDYYRQFERNHMVVQSRVDVYQEGAYVGSYETRSVLHRLSPIGLPSLCRIEPKPE